MKRTEIEQLLPGIVQRTASPGTPLAALLDTMESLHAGPEQTLARLAELFDPHRTPDEFVPFLAAWLDLAHLLDTTGGDRLPTRSNATISTGLGRLRALIASAAELSKWTGTAKGLRLFLQTATGETGFEIRENIDRDGRPRLFHLTVLAPASMRLHKDLIERIIAAEKPAYVTCDLVLASA